MANLEAPTGGWVGLLTIPTAMCGAAVMQASDPWMFDHTNDVIVGVRVSCGAE